MMSERRVVKIIRKVLPAVVTLTISRPLKEVEKELTPQAYPTLPINPKTKKPEIPAEFIEENGLVQIGSGSGFIVSPEGLILTNKHVVSEPHATYGVLLNDGRRFLAVVVSRDPINDIGILQIEMPEKSPKLPVIELGDATELELGRTVIAIGNALGIFKNTVSVGIVSGLSRAISAQADPKTPPQELRGLIQTDAAINPGNSGGPLVNLKGKVVGINAAIISGAQNIGLAIPINAAERDLLDIKRFGRIRQPYLGIRYLIIDERIKSKMGFPVDYGAFVTREGVQDYAVIPGSPADKAKIRENDIVLEFNSKKIDMDHSIQDFLETVSVGDSVVLTILRNEKTTTVAITLTERS